jgi:hypothetical protein
MKSPEVVVEGVSREGRGFEHTYHTDRIKQYL